MEFIFIISYRSTGSQGLSIIYLSIAVSILVTPLYLIAEKYQRKEQDIQKQMKRMKDNIKEVFKGDKRYMMLSTLYRQHHYHPLYALRSSFGLLVQIPIFLAAWHFLTNVDLLMSYFYRFFLERPDSLLVINGVSINVLPVIMTLISLVSAAVYSKGFSLKDIIWLYILPFVFLFLLYKLPSCLVLYWTCNNIFSLIRIIIKKTKLPKLVLYWTSSLMLAFKSLFIKNPALETKQENYTGIFALSLTVLFLLAGFFIPSSLIETGVFEFVVIEGYKNPVLFILNTMMQSFGIFLLWPLCIYYLFGQKTKRNMTKLAAAFAVVTLINVFIFPGNYGILTSMFQFEDPIPPAGAAGNLNLFVIIIAFTGILLFSLRFRKITVSIMAISVCALILTGAVNIRHIRNEFKYIQSQIVPEQAAADSVYKFSKTGKNVVVIMLDRAIAGYVPHIFEEKPELHDSFDGFTWYNNTVSFGGWTHFGMPPLFGGYEYALLELNKRDDKSLREKHNEALLLLPVLFIDQGFNVTVTDPSLANYRALPDLSIFAEYPQIHAENISGKYTQHWLNKNINFAYHFEKIAEYMIHFSFFRLTPSLFRDFVYNDGNWLIARKVRAERVMNHRTLHNYIALEVLPEITEISETSVNNYNTLVNNLTHEPAYLQAPDYIPVNRVTDTGNGPFSIETHYHVNMASFLLLGKWFDFLKENNVYDNTRIIIASDHGRTISSKLSGNFVLPNGRTLSSYNALFLVKDFNAHGSLSVDDTFMTHADAPLIALDGIVENPVNPWTGKILKSDKENGVTFTTAYPVGRRTGNRYFIRPDEWIHVHTSIFDPENWSNVTIE
jgi:YidC/Oxa1 family membrane protein insertase